MTDEQLDAIEARATAATPGPWVWWMSELPPFTIGAKPNSHVGIGQMLTGADADFVTMAREDVPALVADVRGLRDRQGRVRDVLVAAMEYSRDVARSSGDVDYPSVEAWLLQLAALLGIPLVGGEPGEGDDAVVA